jgi:hypothetical protein
VGYRRCLGLTGLQRREGGESAWGGVSWFQILPIYCTIRMRKWRLRWVGHVARKGWRFLRSCRRWKDRIQVALKGKECEGLAWTHSYRDRAKCQAVVKTAMNLAVGMRGMSATSQELLASQKNCNAWSWLLYDTVSAVEVIGCPKTMFLANSIPYAWFQVSAPK